MAKRPAFYAAILIAAASAWWSTPNSGLSARTSAAPYLKHGPEPLSVLTYNVHGLPWPIAADRTPALRAIGARLAALRREGKQPSIVVLQEAFTPEAKQIGTRAGYRFVIEGPSRDLASGIQPDSRDKAFAAQARWLKGEQLGKFYDSGLVLLSDLPVLDVKRVAFPRFACAGYDCLANKGALMVTVRDELTGRAVQVVTSHLNSRHSSYVPERRSLYAYGRQVDALTRFIQRNRDAAAPLIVAGDLNASSGDRRAILRQAAASWDQEPFGGIDDVLHHCISSSKPCGDPLPSDAAVAMNYSRDWQFYGSGSNARLEAIGVSVPFGHDRGGAMLSDHIGYIAMYRVD
jgi:endonuclease/exonuclease/phosphatase family metal-dependent hydrolase